MNELKGKFADVFGGLAALEDEHKKFVMDNELSLPEDKKKSSKSDSHMKNRSNRSRSPTSYRHRDHRSYRSSHRPYERLSRGHRQRCTRGRQLLPDHKVNPERWTRYDLSDVDDSQLTQRSNTSTAFSFLRDLRSVKNKPSSVATETCPDVTRCLTEENNFVAPVIFKKPLHGASDQLSASEGPVVRKKDYQMKGVVKPIVNQSKIECETPKSTNAGATGQSTDIVFRKPSYCDKDTLSCSIYRGTTLVMPEYQVGDKPRSQSTSYRASAMQPSISAQVKLAHVQSDDDCKEEQEEDSTPDAFVNTDTQDTCETDAKFKFVSKKKQRHIRKTRINQDDD